LIPPFSYNATIARISCQKHLLLKNNPASIVTVDAGLFLLIYHIDKALPLTYTMSYYGGKFMSRNYHMVAMDTKNLTIMPEVALSKSNRVFSWLEYLSSEEQANFYTDFFAAIEQALDTKDWTILEQTIESWQATAEVFASAELTATLTVSANEDDWEEWDNVESELFSTSA